MSKAIKNKTIHLRQKLIIASVILGTIGCILLACVLFMKSSYFKVDFVTTETHLELGETMTTDPSYYLEGDPWIVSLSRVDTSSVKKAIGRYPVYIQHGFEKYTCYVSVTDTTAPVISCDIKNLTVKPGEIVSINSLGLDVQDYSKVENIYFSNISSSKFYTGLPEDQIADMIEAYRKGIDLWATEFQFAYGGVYLLTITAEDEFHNTSDTTLTLKVEQAPILEVPTDFYVASAVDLEFEKYITAWDFIDEDFSSDDVEVDTSQLNLGSSGEYPITFTGTDSYGLKSTVGATVHVYTQAELQELINTHQININDHVIIGAYNAYDSGYYTDGTISSMQDAALPYLVHIENDHLETFGSGFILEIDDEFVTIVSNEHVTQDDLIVDVTFYDGTVKNGSVVASDAREDISFIQIPIDGSSSNSSVTSEYVKKLRTAHINKNYWDSLSNDCGLNIGFTCIDINGDIWAKETATIVEKVALRDWNSYSDVKETIISSPPLAGSSGSPIFDEQGHLVGMVRGYTDYETYIETVAVPLSEILDYYEMVFKTRVEYQ